MIGRILARRLTTPPVIAFLRRFGQLAPTRHGAAILANLAGITTTHGADITNAFNMLYRSFLLRAVVAFAPDAAQLTALLYTTPSRIDFGAADVSPLRGVRQGCPAAAPLFALSVAHALSLAPSPPPVLMYADDVIFDPTSDPAADYDATAAALAPAGLSLKPLTVGNATCGGCAPSDDAIPHRLVSKIPRAVKLLELIRTCTAPLHVKFHALRCVPSLFQYHIFATGLSHPDIAKELALQVDAAITDSIERLTDIPVSHIALLGIQPLLPTVLPARIVIARGHDDHLPDNLRIHLNTGRTLHAVSGVFTTSFNTPPTTSTRCAGSPPTTPSIAPNSPSLQIPGRGGGP